MPEFLDIFLQKTTIAGIVNDRPPLSKSLIAYILSLAVVLIGITIGTLFEQIFFYLLGWKELIPALLEVFSTFTLHVLIAIPGLIGLIILIGVYFGFAKVLGGTSSNFKQFLSNYLLVLASVGIFVGIASMIPFLRHIVVFLLAVYGFFLLVKLISEYFSISFIKAFFAWFVPTALLGLVALLLATIVGTFLYIL